MLSCKCRDEFYNVILYHYFPPVHLRCLFCTRQHNVSLNPIQQEVVSPAVNVRKKLSRSWCALLRPTFESEHIRLWGEDSTRCNLSLSWWRSDHSQESRADDLSILRIEVHICCTYRVTRSQMLTSSHMWSSASVGTDRSWSKTEVKNVDEVKTDLREQFSGWLRAVVFHLLPVCAWLRWTSSVRNRWAGKTDAVQVLLPANEVSSCTVWAARRCWLVLTVQSVSRWHR